MPEALTAAIRRVTGAVLGDARDRLSAAVAEVQRLQAELKTIENEVSARRFATLRSCSDESQPPMGLAASLLHGDPDEAWRTFVRRNPCWREAIKSAAAAKLEIAEGQAREVEKKVREELSDDEFTEHAILQHPRLAKARHAVALWKSLRGACDDPKASQGVWSSVTKQLP